MKIAPLIYSRTLHCDFNSNFAVRPNDLNVHWAADKILASMKDLDIFNGVRRVVASDNGTGIAGVACTFKFFVENYLPEEVKAFEKYFRDEVRREVKIFLGYAFKMSGKPEIPNVTDADLLKFFIDKLAPEWERKFVETVYSDYAECDTKTFSGNIKPVETINGVDIYQDEVFEQCLASAQVKNLSYCSNVNQFDIWERGQFSSISTSQNDVISKLRNSQKKTPSESQPPRQSSAQHRQVPPFQQNPTPRTQDRRPSTETKSNKLLATCATGLIVIMAIIFLLTR